MFNDPLFTLLLLACAAVLVVLAVGIGGLTRSGRFNARHGNRMMRWRLIAQAVAIALFVIFALLQRG